MKSSNSFINKKNVNKTANEKIKKNNKNKTTTRQVESNLIQIHSQKNKSFYENQKLNNMLLKKKKMSNKKISSNKTEKKKSKNNTKNHRPIISTDFCLCLEFSSLNINKKRNNENNSKNKINNLIKVNTKRNHFNNLLSLREENKTNKKNENNNKYKNLEKDELIKNLSEINILNNKEKKKINKKKETYDMIKIKYIQKWWKNIFLKKKILNNSIIFLIKSIKKAFLFKKYILHFPRFLIFFINGILLLTKKKS